MFGTSVSDEDWTQEVSSMREGKKKYLTKSTLLSYSRTSNIILCICAACIILLQDPTSCCECCSYKALVNRTDVLYTNVRHITISYDVLIHVDMKTRSQLNLINSWNDIIFFLFIMVLFGKTVFVIAFSVFSFITNIIVWFGYDIFVQS